MLFRRKVQVSKLPLTRNNRHSLYTHPLPLSGVDSRGLSVAAYYCGLIRTCDEDGGRGVSCHTPRALDTPIAGLAYFCTDPSNVHGDCYLTFSSP